MPITFYQRLQAYRELPVAFKFSKKQLHRMSHIVKFTWNKRIDNPPLTYIESIEETGTFQVRLYPDEFSNTIDKIIWSFHAKIYDRLNPPIKKERKRIPAKAKPVFSSRLK